MRYIWREVASGFFMPEDDDSVRVSHEQRTVRLLARPLAGTADRSMARDLRHVASLDPDRRQDSSGARALAESFLARRPLCHDIRPDDLPDPRWHAHVPDRL